ncbi:hypothetical protein AQUCO_00400630v1 [Aquilegia coerulea]|uniref:CCR4-NOT transcription complex subunit 3 n=1 Tax=Aquilegia coerulea TaxID=218851 RepID=A0A2G5EVY7_AQUCA|nr:hypothetical protein AQUCO_00400630v1 [Aquilegia coerulea]
MGASRKLQGEIDRVLKKVQEGVDVFDSIWNKVYDTDNANQKEKFEADLKKEIKKLQRYRDQIKTWIQSSEIKDKKVSASYEQALLDARKLIEREMERFKVCEKETKTKAFSKEGLGQQPKTDPREKAKSETRDWLNNVVSELESQVDYFEAEIEGLSVKKGKTRPPRLTHLETSIARHKAHIMKLELILRLLDNDELSPEQVNDVKDFLDDYVERNQDDFEEFSDVDELYSSLPLDKVESLEDLVAIGPPSLVKGVGAASAVLSLKTSVPASPTQTQGNSFQEQVEEIASLDSNSENPPRTPPSKNGALSTSTSTTPTGNLAAAITVNAPARSLAAGSAAAAVLSSAGPVRSALDNSATTVASSPINIPSPGKEEEIRRASPSLENALGRGIGRASLSGVVSNQSLNSVPLNSGSPIPSPNSLGPAPAISELAKRSTSGVDERIGSGGMGQPLVSPMSNRILLPQISKPSDATGSTESNNVGEQTVLGGRVFSPSVVPGVQWRPQSGSSFQNANEAGQVRGRTEIAPDQREKYVQRLQQPTQHSLMSTGPKDTEVSHSNTEDQHQQQNQSEDSNMESVMSSGLNKNVMSEDDLKSPYAVDKSGGGLGPLSEPAQMPRDTDLSPGQPLQSNQPSVNLGVIGRRSVSDLGAIGDNISASTPTSGGGHDHVYNQQMLEAAFYKLPQPKDSERAKSYIPRHPVVTPPSYPQNQLPIFENPAFWERLGRESAWGTDTLFFAFYYQQNTYQQYLAARELKKQSWRYHRKYNTWFQRHEEPKVTTDEFEQGTYVYFDFHTANDDLQQGWVQRIKTEFTFEYSYLEDELVV